MYQRDYYKDRMSDLVRETTSAIEKIMAEEGVEKIMFSQHGGVLRDGRAPVATFYRKGAGASRQEVGTVLCSDSGTGLTFVSADGRFSACVEAYEDYGFDSASALPEIYAAVCDIVDAEDVCPNERI